MTTHRSAKQIAWLKTKVLTNNQSLDQSANSHGEGASPEDKWCCDKRAINLFSWRVSFSFRDISSMMPLVQKGCEDTSRVDLLENEARMREYQWGVNEMKWLTWLIIVQASFMHHCYELATSPAAIKCMMGAIMPMKNHVVKSHTQNGPGLILGIIGSNRWTNRRTNQRPSGAWRAGPRDEPNDAT